MKRKINLEITGMNCAACARTIEKSLDREQDIISVNVNLANNYGQVEYEAEALTEEDIKNRIKEAGYGVKNIKEKADTNQNRRQRYKDLDDVDRARGKMKGVWLFTFPIIVWMIPKMTAGIVWPNSIIYNLGIIVLAGLALVIFGGSTYKSAYNSIKHGSTNMDVLIALGTGAAFVTGPLVFFVPIANYAGVAGMIMAFHLTGKYIEEKAKGRTSRAIKKLLQMEASTATILEEGQKNEVPVEQLSPGDIMLVKPGEKIPTDGKIIEGKTTVDESMVTGESMPVSKTSGDEVIGTTINRQGLIKVKVTEVGEDTFLSQVVTMVEEAQGTKVPIQKFADKVTSIFVPAVLIIALTTFLSWIIFPDILTGVIFWAQGFLPWVNPELGTFTLAVFAAIAVLVIACPCALGLATPTALMVGSGMGAQQGVLIRNGEAIQIMKDVHTIVFDKTGTITKASPGLLI